MNIFLVCFISGSSALLGFLLFFHPLQQNVKANRWLGIFVFLIGAAFLATYMLITGMAVSHSVLFKCISSLQFLLAPVLYISILYFIQPAKIFHKANWLHFIPFIMYVAAEITCRCGKESISTFSLFKINKDVSFLVRDILPFLTLFYLIRSYAALVKHKNKLKLISSAISNINLDWLLRFLLILLLTVITWINDALFELPFLTQATPFIYALSVFFLAYFSIKQKTVFAFNEKDIKEIAEVLEYEAVKNEANIPAGIAEAAKDTAAPAAVANPPAAIKERPRLKRLSAEQVAILAVRLVSLMEQDKLFLDNELSLPVVAAKLGIGIHEASFLVNETTGDNFYNFINKYRVEESKKLLASAKIEELNILGIAFASGFNSKTAFNTSFKKIVGMSPTRYSKEQKKQP